MFHSRKFQEHDSNFPSAFRSNKKKKSNSNECKHIFPVDTRKSKCVSTYLCSSHVKTTEKNTQQWKFPFINVQPSEKRRKNHRYHHNHIHRKTLYGADHNHFQKQFLFRERKFFFAKVQNYFLKRCFISRETFPLLISLLFFLLLLLKKKIKRILAHTKKCVQLLRISCRKNIF